MVPEMLIRAGTTGDVYALFESATIPGRNEIELSKEGDVRFRQMGSLPLKKGIAADGPEVQELLFANAMNGIAVAQLVSTKSGTASPFFVTHDGGATWRTEEISPTTQIRELASTPQYWYAITDQCPPVNAQCSQYRLERAPVSTMRWTTFAIPPPLAKYGSDLNLTAFGSDVWLSTMNQVSEPYSSYVAISHDYGVSYTVSVHPVLNSVTACGLEAMSYEVVWAICDQGMMAGQIPYSDDGGIHWILKESSFKQPNILSSFAFGSFDPVNDAIAFAVDGFSPHYLYRITSGSTPAEIVGSITTGQFPSTLCFVNERVGFLLNQGEGGPSTSLFYTNDGGLHWSKDHS
jgi:hypothetical protein